MRQYISIVHALLLFKNLFTHSIGRTEFFSDIEADYFDQCCHRYRKIGGYLEKDASGKCSSTAPGKLLDWSISDGRVVNILLNYVRYPREKYTSLGKGY